MRVTCPYCGTPYRLPETVSSRLPAFLRCAKCKQRWRATPDPLEPVAQCVEPAPSTISLAVPPAPQPWSPHNPASGLLRKSSPAPPVPAAAEPAEAPVDTLTTPDVDPPLDSDSVSSEQPRHSDMTAAPEDESAITGKAGAPAAEEPDAKSLAEPGAREAVLAASRESDLANFASVVSRADTAKAEGIKDSTLNRLTDPKSEAELHRALIAETEKQQPDPHIGEHSARLPALSQRVASRAAGAGVLWVASILVLSFIIVLIILLRGPISHFWPPSLRLYRALGLMSSPVRGS